MYCVDITTNFQCSCKPGYPGDGIVHNGNKEDKSIIYLKLDPNFSINFKFYLTLASGLSFIQL